MESIRWHQPPAHPAGLSAPPRRAPVILVEALVCILDCSLGAAAGLGIGIVLDWPVAASGALAAAAALAWCLAGADCAFMRRGIRLWKQHG
ncbi:MAG: hypothetical protein JNM90_23000 [Burkholderiales bacterium]|nr:hypothetical protein [Burkholderiales bacterium]